MGVSPDGKLIWYSTTQPLVNADTDTSRDLYVSKVENGQLTEVVQASHGDASDPTPGTGANVLGTTAVSRDLTAESFVALGVLTTAPNSFGETAQAGADNLYVYDVNSEEIKFVAKLCSGPEKSGPEKSGFVIDSKCPGTLNSLQDEAAGTNDVGLWQDGGSPRRRR